MEFQLVCPRCRGPLREDVQVDRGDLEVKDKSPVVFQTIQCLRCGYKKTHILQGLPDDDESYAAWARSEANLLINYPQYFETKNEQANGLAS